MRKTIKFLSWAILAVVLCVGISSCKDDDDETSVNDVTGVYYSHSVSEYEDDVLIETSEEADIRMEVQNVSDKQFLIKEEMFDSFSKSWKPMGNYIITLDGSSAKLNVNDSDVNTEYVFSFGENKLKVTQTYVEEDVEGKIVIYCDKNVG